MYRLLIPPPRTRTHGRILVSVFRADAGDIQQLVDAGEPPDAAPVIENALRGHRPHAGNGIQLLCGRGIEIDPRICGGPIVRTVTPLLR